MPSRIVAIEFLSDDQVRRYGAFVADPTPEELERFFFLNAAALEVAGTERRRHNRLGWVGPVGDPFREFFIGRNPA